jgi:ABC-type transport system substrate-binding protein
VTAPAGAVIVLYMNLHGVAPYHQLRDSALRRAVAMAIDRRTLVERVLGGGGSAALVATVNPPSVLDAHAALVHGVPYDAAAAARALHGRRRTLALIANPGALDRATVEYVQAQLAGVGIAVAVDPLDAAAYESRLNSGAFDLDLKMPSQNDANPAFLLALRWYSRSGTRSAAFTHASPRVDALVEHALAAATDDDARRAAATAMHQLVDVEVGAVPLAGISRIYAMTGRVRGFAPHPSRLNQDWSTVWLAPRDSAR